jgi:polyhydroxyalkanoate synthase subunit PhaE
VVESSKDWTDQVEAIAKAWTEAQKTIGEKWFEFMRAAPAASEPQREMTAQWSKLAQEGLEAWTATSTGATAKGTAQRLLASQEAWMRTVELATQAWRTIVAKMESGEDWQSALTHYLNDLRQQSVLSPEKILKSTQDLGELWRLYLAEFQKLAQPWVNGLQQAETQLGAVASGDKSALLELSRLYWDSIDQSVGRLLQSPGLGSTRELSDKFAKSFAAWQELQEASVAYQVILAGAATRVLEQSLTEMSAMAERGETIESIRQWIIPLERVADPVLTEIFGSDEFVRVQGRLLNAAMAYRIRQREIIEEFLKIADVPTRSEVDEIHQTLYMQRKEIKALKKALAKCTATIDRLTKQSDSNRSEPEMAQHTIVAARSNVETLQAEPSRRKKSVRAKSAQVK